MESNINYYNEYDEDLNINVKKIFFCLWNRKKVIFTVFSATVIFFLLLTFVLPKKYVVEADLYISKNNPSNFVEANPYFIDETSASIISTGSDKIMLNEIELMQSPLVMDKVIKNNNLVYKKKFGILPNKKEGEYISTKSFLKKNIKIENKKNTNVVTIKYKNGKPDVAHAVVSSIIENYVDLHKQLNEEKSKSDKKIIETEYNNAKQKLNHKLNSLSGLPENAAGGTGNLSAMSVFSNSAQKAMSTLTSQIRAGEKSKVEVGEEATKVSDLASKLEWAKLVEEMSDASKVIVLKEPEQLRDFEYSSPKLLINIFEGIIFGIIFSLFAVIYLENYDKKLSYSMLEDNIIYSLQRDINELKTILLTNSKKRILVVLFNEINNEIYEKLKHFTNISYVKPDVSQEFVNIMENSTDVVLVAKIGETDSIFYKQIKKITKDMNKNIISEILV